MQDFFEQLEQRIAKYDLLTHPFYQAWSSGELTAEDLRAYSADYYHHVAAFPTYLSAFHSRLADGELRRAVLRNLADEEIDGTAHSELWLDFARAFGNERSAVKNGQPSAETAALIAHFRAIARTASPAAALAAFYAYESQVPRVAQFKDCALRDFYSASEKACRYFALHKTADVHHSQVWRDELGLLVAAEPDSTVDALTAAETAAKALWNALDGMEARRKTPAIQ